jgi:hypothetical protein
MEVVVSEINLYPKLRKKALLLLKKIKRPQNAKHQKIHKLLKIIT